MCARHARHARHARACAELTRSPTCLLGPRHVSRPTGPADCATKTGAASMPPGTGTSTAEGSSTRTTTSTLRPSRRFAAFAIVRACAPRSAPRAPPRVHTLSMRKPADLCQESTPHKNSADGSSLFVTAMFPFEVSSDGAPARLGLLGLDHNACRCCRLRLFGAFPPLPPARPRRMTSAQT